LVDTSSIYQGNIAMSANLQQLFGGTRVMCCKVRPLMTLIY